MGKQCHSTGCVDASVTKVDQQTYIRDKKKCCTSLGEESVAVPKKEAEVGGLFSYRTLQYPSECHILGTILGRIGSINMWSCKGGEALVADHVCCPLSVWEHFE